MNDAPAVLPRWEYKVVQYVGSLWNSSGEWSQPEFEGWCTEQVLNHLGAEGWELVSLGPVHGETSTPAAAYIMKRRDTKNEL